jgi:DNA helicase HerA-like ATPase
MSYKLKLGWLPDIRQELPHITSLKDRFHHAYIVGKTGMGKSSMMERMAFYDIEEGNGVIYIDPKGDSTKRLYSLIPDKEKVIYVSIKTPKIINPLDKAQDVDIIISEFVEILNVLISLTSSNPEATVLMKELISRAIKAITRDEDKNIEYLVKFLMYEDVRKKAMPYIEDTEIRKYWEIFDNPKEHAKSYKIRQKQETAQRVASRLIEVSEGKMRNFVVGRNELDISDIVTNGKVVLVDTSKMSMNARIYLSNLIVYSVLSYCEFSDINPKPLLVYVDEFQIVVSDWFADLLARSRSRQVGFTLAHQSFAQIPRNILSVIMDTVHTIVCFRTGDEVANRLSGFFDVKSKELFNLPKFNAWVRIGTDNSMIECYPPLEVKEMVSPAEPILPPMIKEAYNFLSDNWVEYDIIR